ncbi:hypothetical protein [Methylovirgula sp. 4M-Z18]|uniref:hypothetical protein n=1 Tax=Methylovirgula sp. 4M-Z18 TaxID=2293567 RepID=UPI0011C058F6|nr:hypothetical protein [Methylovirgula sp. 4M-Z18]
MSAIQTVADDARRASELLCELIHVDAFEVTPDADDDVVSVRFRGCRPGEADPREFIFRLNEEAARKLSIDLSTIAYRLRLARGRS